MMKGGVTGQNVEELTRDFLVPALDVSNVIVLDHNVAGHIRAVGREVVSLSSNGRSLAIHQKSIAAQEQYQRTQVEHKSRTWL